MHYCGSKVVASISLSIAQIAVALLYKLAQTNGQYSFSTISVIIMAELIKFSFAFCLILFTTAGTETCNIFIVRNDLHDKLLSIRSTVQQQLSIKFILHTFILALLYCTNNQIAFILFQRADVVSITLSKAFTSLLSAILLRTIFKRTVNSIQWCSIALQVMGLMIAQYDVCKSMPLLKIETYLIVFISCFITSVSSVWNENLVKNYSVNIHIQNSLLYFFGFFFNVFIFVFFNEQISSSSRNLFEGYSMYTAAIIFCNSIMGLVITAVYKYADAIIKTFSIACATGILIFLNSRLFDVPTNLIQCLGVMVIFLSSYIYFSAQITASTQNLQ